MCWKQFSRLIQDHLCALWVVIMNSVGTGLELADPGLLLMLWMPKDLLSVMDPGAME